MLATNTSSSSLRSTRLSGRFSSASVSLKMRSRTRRTSSTLSELTVGLSSVSSRRCTRSRSMISELPSLPFPAPRLGPDVAGVPVLRLTIPFTYLTQIGSYSSQATLLMLCWFLPSRSMM